MVSLTTRRGFVLGAVTAPFVARFARAQAFPSRPVRIVIGFPPGGGIDILARLIAPSVSR
jgi:tripartite-type tricarboxylate transporter receptor subunit TctC